MSGDEEVHVFNMPMRKVQLKTKTENRIDVNRIKEIFSFYEPETEYLGVERQWARPGHNIVASCTLCSNYGGLRTLIESHGFRYTEMEPQEWQKLIGKEQGNDKEESIKIASKLFPSVEIKRHDQADALLIAEAARRLITSTS